MTRAARPRTWCPRSLIVAANRQGGVGATSLPLPEPRLEMTLVTISSRGGQVLLGQRQDISGLDPPLDLECRCAVRRWGRAEGWCAVGGPWREGAHAHEGPRHNGACVALVLSRQGPPYDCSRLDPWDPVVAFAHRSCEVRSCRPLDTRAHRFVVPTLRTPRQPPHPTTAPTPSGLSPMLALLPNRAIPSRATRGTVLRWSGKASR